MGEGNPVVGLVVPNATTTSTWGETLRGAAVKAAMLDDDDDDALSGAHESKRPNRKRSESSVDLTIALQAIRHAIEGLKEIQPGMLRHRLEHVLSDPLSQLGHAERALEQGLRRMGRGA